MVPDGPLSITVSGGLEAGGVGLPPGAVGLVGGEEGSGLVGPDAFTPEPGIVMTPASRQSFFLL